MSNFWNFYKLKIGDPVFGGQRILQKVWIIWSPLLYFTFKTINEPNSLSFIRFQCILYDLEELLSDFWNFLNVKTGDLILGWKQFCRKSRLFGPPFCISILKVLCTKIFRHSLELNVFCLIQEYVSQTIEIPTN